MTIIVVRCDQCDRLIDAEKGETWRQNENGHWCDDCEEKYGAIC